MLWINKLKKSVVVVMYMLVISEMIWYTQIHMPISWLWIGIITFVVGEILYIKEKNKPCKQDMTFWGKIRFATKRKAFNIFEVFISCFVLRLVGLIGYGVYKLITIINWLKAIKPIGIFIGVGVVLFLYLWLNSLKYKKAHKK